MAEVVNGRLVDSATLDGYQAKAMQFAKYPGVGINLTYAIVGLAGEVGELAGQFSKYIRKPCDGHDLVEVAARKERLADELGDALWFVADVAHELGYSLSEIADMNLSKLSSRSEKGTLTSTETRHE